tara:strand:+ start:229 stop:438 length:210 start_codon:yes stop_codon:yes gene_type:complete
MTKVFVKDGQYERALRKFKKKITENGLLQQVRDNEFFEKPTTVKKRKKAVAANRWRKQVEEQKLPKRSF